MPIPSRAVSALAAGLLALSQPLAWAGPHTPAGTVISNVAQVSYTLEGEPEVTLTSPPATLRVQELIGLTLTPQDMGAVAVNSPDNTRALSFTLVNTGNGPETFSLARIDTLTGDQFDPTPQGIFLESGAQAGFQVAGPDADILYIPGSNDPALGAGAGAHLYLVSDIPAVRARLAQGFSRILATSLTAGPSAPGTVIPGAGTDGVDVVVGLSGGAVYAQSVYTVSGVLVTLSKNVTSVIDPHGGDRVMSGSVVGYRVVVDVTGDGIAEDLSISDPLPAGMTYVPGSLRLDGLIRTEEADGDSAAIAGGVVTVRLGNIVAPATHVLELSAYIN